MPAFHLSPAALTNLPELLAFCQACETAAAGLPLLTSTRLRGLWTQPRFDTTRATRIARSTAGEIFGYAAVFDTMEPPVDVGLQLYIHPRLTGDGAGEALLTWAEARARQAVARAPVDARVILWTNALHTDAAQIALLQLHGFRRMRTHYKMQIDLDTPPPAPALPPPLTLTSFATKAALFAELPAVMSAVDASFQDVWGYVKRPLSARVALWTHRLNNNSDSDPTVWWVARDGSTIAGFCLCTPTYDGDGDKAHVHMLGVLRPYRRQGLGLAMLQHTFGEFHRRGKRAVDLGVDADSLTGATRLYERAGMRIVRQYDNYEKELRAGRDFTAH